MVDDVMRVRVHGPFNLPEWREVLYGLRSVPGFRINQNSIIDAREASFDFSTADVHALVASIPGILEGRGHNFRTAYVVGRDVDFGIARMAQMLADKFSFKAETFRTMEEAEVWITLRDSVDE